MKKLLYFFILLVFVQETLFGVITGSGTYLDPYTGTLNTSTTWSGRTYFDVVNVGIGGSLTISAGATILAVNPTSSLTISDTGVLTAIGTTISIITFSADNNGDGVPGPGETWKNILFDYLCSGSSHIDYAIIENGTGDDYTYGGGIDIWGNNITISNSTIRNCNNSSGNGGGISATPYGSNVSLINLKIHDNTSVGNGGGLFTDGNVNISACEIYNNSATSGAGVYLNAIGSISNSLIHDNSGGEGVYSFGSNASGSITNCIIYNNSVGIYFYGERNIVNCTVINNTTGITSATAVAPKIINTVLWGNTTQYLLESGGNMVLAYCGIQGGFSVGNNGGGNKTLSAINEDDIGPNFVNASTNFHINASIAPLVDGGIASYTGVTIPGTDIEGKSRIGTIDIGAYEFVYYIWTGITSTDWSTTSNWTGSPSSVPTSIIDNKVIIPKGRPNYPTVASLSLSTRSILTIEPQAGLTVNGATSVGSGCTFNLKSDATGSANFITGSSVSGSFNVELFLAGGGNPNFKWHYVTPPVASINKSVLTTSISNPFNLLNYIEPRVTTDKQAGWNWHDGIPAGSTVFNTLLNTFGYNVYVSTDQTALFNGTVRAGTLFNNSNITFTSTDAAQSGWNLIGNPFTCGVDANSFNFGTNLDIDKTVYFTRDNQYLAWSVAGNAGINGATNIIPSMQGFFVHAASNGPSRTLRIPSTSRSYTTLPLYKGAKGSKGTKESRTNPFLKFNVSDGASLTDESIIYFFADATTGFDGDYDAYKMLAENPAHPQIYSVAENINLGINGLPINETITTVPLRIRIGVAKNYTINILDLQNLTDTKVTLIHGTNRIDLKTNPSYTFSAAAGVITDMAVEFDMSIATDVNVASKDQTACWYSNGSVLIKTGLAGFEDNSSVVIYDVTGKVVFRKNNVSLGKGETVEIPVSLDNGLYITNVSNKNIKWSKKLVISH